MRTFTTRKVSGVSVLIDCLSQARSFWSANSLDSQVVIRIALPPKTREVTVNIFETIGMLWVIFTSVLSTLAIGYLTVVGLKTVVKANFLMKKDVGEVTLEESSHVDVKEPLKVAR